MAVRTGRFVIIDRRGLGVRAAYPFARNMANMRSSKHTAAAARVGGNQQAAGAALSRGVATLLFDG